MNKENLSSAWFFITYLIYAFSNKVNRYSKKCYGQTIKYGTIESDNLVLLGQSATTSGDGNYVKIKLNKMSNRTIYILFYKKNDWNRFWIEN